MRLVSIDLETTGLDPTCCDVIEFSAVVFDSDKPDVPVEELPTFHAYIVRAVYQGEPFALGMHAAIFKRIADREPGFTYLTEDELGEAVARWLDSLGFETGDDDLIRVNATGKNFGMFDMRFLDKNESWRDTIAIVHRVTDPGTLFFDPKRDKKIPDTRECLKRAGLDARVVHTAIEDARNVVRLLRYAWALIVQSKVRRGLHSVFGCGPLRVRVQHS